MSSIAQMTMMMNLKNYLDLPLLYTVTVLCIWFIALNINPENNHKFPEHEDVVSARLSARYSSSSSSSNEKDSKIVTRNDRVKLHYNDFGALKTPAPALIESAPKTVRFNNDNPSKLAANLLDLHRKSFDQKYLEKGEVIPCIVTPTLHDGDLLRTQLMKYDAPVRHFVFIVNAKDSLVEKIFSEIEPLTDIGAVSILRHDNFNAGFAAAINMGMRRARQVLSGQSEYRNFLANWTASPLWYFAVNCDAIFPQGNLAKFASAVNNQLNEYYSSNKPQEQQQKQQLSPPGLFFGNVVDFYATGITDAAVQKAGELDEVFYPAYMEDIDWKWRIHLAGFKSVTTGVVIGHFEHINIRRIMSDKKNHFMKMMRRCGYGFSYGWLKWGHYTDAWTRAEVPPNGRTTPFGIANFPLSLWKVDPVHRKCVITGEGVYYKKSRSCWYNISVLRDQLPAGTVIPQHLLRP